MTVRNDDKRVVRTKRILRDTLTELIEEKGLERVTVSDLTKRADINRGTFYAHYKDKDDLLMQSENEIIQGVTDIQKRLCGTSLDELFECYKTNTPMPFAVALYDYLRENGRFVKALIGPKGDSRFQPRLQNIVALNTAQNVLNEKYRDNMTPLVQYYLAYYTGAQLGVIQLWLDNGMQESSKDMARIVVAIMFMRPGDAIELQQKYIKAAQAASIKGGE